VDGLTDTPGSVLPRCCRRGSSGHPSTNAVAGALQRPTRTLGRAALKRVLSGLAPGGVYLAFPVTREAGGLLHRRFTLTCFVPLSNRRDAGGLFSVALACGLPRVGVTHHPALWSPDVPRATCVARGRLVNPSAVQFTGFPAGPDTRPARGLKSGNGPAVLHPATLAAFDRCRCRSDRGIRLHSAASTGTRPDDNHFSARFGRNTYFTGNNDGGHPARSPIAGFHGVDPDRRICLPLPSWGRHALVPGGAASGGG
jgi:hypothetical protein